MNIITGYRNEPHVDAQEFRNQNMGTFGSGTYILDVGSKMAATVVSATQITIADGIMIGEGNTAEVAYGTSETLAIDNGSQGMFRTDLIVARYTNNASIEDMELVVIKGTPAASDPATPAHNNGKIADGDSPVDFPLYAVHLDGISITSVERLVDVVSIKGGIDTANAKALEVEDKIPAMTIKTFTWTSIGINSNLAPTYIYGIAQSGYKPVAIAGYEIRNNDGNGKNAGWCVMTKATIGREAVNGSVTDSMKFAIWNQHTSQQAIVKVVFKVFYVSEGALS